MPKLSDADKVILRDLQGFIEFAIKTDTWELNGVLVNVHHDASGIVLNEVGFSPRTSGYAKHIKA